MSFLSTVGSGLISGGIGAAGSIIGGLINSGSQSENNQKQLDFAQKMYDQQKTDSLDMWNKQNAYNSPQSQMDRLKSAGLNPNLVYGNGSAVNTASPVSVPSQPHVALTAPRPGDAISAGASAGLSNYYDTQIKSAQIDNLKAQNTNIAEDTALKTAQTFSTLMGGSNTQFDLGLKGELHQNSLDAAGEQLRKLKLGNENIQFSTNKLFADTNNANLSTAQNIRESIQRIANMKSQKVGQDTMNKLSGVDLELKKMGIEKGDPIYYRVLGHVAHALGFTDFSTNEK